MDITILENSCGIAEDEIDRACYQTIYEELTICVDMEGVLVSKHVAFVECRAVRTNTQRHGLAVGRAGCVLEGDVPGQESFTHGGCIVHEKC
jgi:hypothetical protein